MVRIQVADAQDPRLADYVRLRDTSLRRHLESAEGLFIAEGEKVIRRAVEAGYRPRSFLLAERWLAGLDGRAERWPDVPVYVVSEALAEEVTGFHVHRGALASLHREERHTVADLLARQRLVVLEDIVDHTNVGAILRNAAALGWDGALLSPRAADPLYRRSIKVSMGAVFSLPWARLPTGRRAGAAGRRRVHHGRPDPGPRRGRPAQLAGRLRADRGWRCCSAPRGPGCRRGGPPARPSGRGSRCAPASTRSTSPRPRRSPATRCRRRSAD